MQRNLEQGVVYDKTPGKLWVALEKPSGSCSRVCETPACRGHGDFTPVHAIEVSVPDESIYGIGETIVLDLYVPNPAFVACIIFGVPLTIALSVLVSWNVISPDTGNSYICIISTISAFFGAFLIVGICDHIFRAVIPTAPSIITDSSSIPRV